MVGSRALLTLKVALELPPLGWAAAAAMVSVLRAEGDGWEVSRSGADYAKGC